MPSSTGTVKLWVYTSMTKIKSPGLHCMSGSGLGPSGCLCQPPCPEAELSSVLSVGLGTGSTLPWGQTLG